MKKSSIALSFALFQATCLHSFVILPDNKALTLRNLKNAEVKEPVFRTHNSPNDSRLLFSRTTKSRSRKTTKQRSTSTSSSSLTEDQNKETVTMSKKKDKAKEKAIEKAKESMKKILKALFQNKPAITTFLKDFAIDKLIAISLKKPADSTIKVFENLDDLFSTLILTTSPQALIKENDNPFTSVNYTYYDKELEERFDLGWEKVGNAFDDWEKGFIAAEIIEVTNDTVLKRIRTDVFYGEPDVVMDILNGLPSNSILFPLNDAILSFNSKEECETLIADVKLNGKSEKGASPDPYKEHVWEGEKSSDENFSRFFFHGIGAALLEQQVEESSKPELGPIEIDIDFMKVLEVREGFRKMGVKMYFDKNQKVTGVYDSAKDKMFKPGDDGWEGAKFLARSSAFTLLTAREHLFQAHLL